MAPIEEIEKVLRDDPRVVFAYLYGSASEGDRCRDVDIAVYLVDSQDAFAAAADLKLALGRSCGLAAETFDVRSLNGVGDLRYLRRVLSGRLLVDKDFDARGDFLESYAARYRESEGILDEAYG
ncbi:MAG: nucleotidyltransferase domain-containing protein [Deltaproteobacteria bacterium]|nr:nucleotidyltransferase domain-containing protein [Deltaproteobacteria bacterium]